MRPSEWHDVLAFLMAEIRAELAAADKSEARTAWLNNAHQHLIEARHALDKAGLQSWANAK